LPKRSRVRMRSSPAEEVTTKYTKLAQPDCPRNTPSTRNRAARNTLNTRNRSKARTGIQPRTRDPVRDGSKAAGGRARGGVGGLGEAVGNSQIFPGAPACAQRLRRGKVTSGYPTGLGEPRHTDRPDRPVFVRGTPATASPRPWSSR
jgi:hypothetical protein